MLLNKGHIYKEPPVIQPTEISEWEYRVRLAKRSGNRMAYRDAKKHLEKLRRKQYVQNQKVVA